MGYKCNAYSSYEDGSGGRSSHYGAFQDGSGGAGKGKKGGWARDDAGGTNGKMKAKKGKAKKKDY